MIALIYIYLILLNYFILIFTHLKLCLATPTHNFKRLQIGHICLILNLKMAMFDA